MTIARLTVQRGDLTEYPLATRTKNGWQNGVTFYPDADVVQVTPLRLLPVVEQAATAGHDDLCEAEFVAEAGGYTSCACSYRDARGLIAAHDAQVAAQALRDAADKGATRQVGSVRGGSMPTAGAMSTTGRTATSQKKAPGPWRPTDHTNSTQEGQ